MYHNFAQLLTEAEGCGGLAQAVLANELELTAGSEDEVYTQLASRWLVMRKAAERALAAPQQMTGNLISGQAARQYTYLAVGAPVQGGLAGQAANLAMALALSSSEVNAAMGRICAAPTAGACGVLPAVLLTVAKQAGLNDDSILEGLLVAGGVGAIITRNATVSGAEGGCQAECGAAAAMAAAAAVVLCGGSPKMAGNAVSIALINCMGLVCDPIAGLVQMPCSFRNASQATNALVSADMALAGQDPLITPDEAIETMGRVGRILPAALRETSEGGIAATATAKKIRKSLALDEL